MRILFAILAIGLGAAAILSGTTIGAFIDPAAMLLVVGLTLCVPLANFSLREAFDAIGTALGDGAVPADQARQHTAVLQTFRMAAAGSGVIGTFIGLVQMLAHMNDPSKIGPAMAMALLTFFYGIILSELVFGPWINRLQRRTVAATSQDGSDDRGKAAAPHTTLVVAGVFSCFVCLSFVLTSLSMHTAPPSEGAEPALQDTVEASEETPTP